MIERWVWLYQRRDGTEIGLRCDDDVHCVACEASRRFLQYNEPQTGDGYFVQEENGPLRKVTVLLDDVSACAFVCVEVTEREANEEIARQAS